MFEQKMISSGDNFPGVDLSSELYQAICIALHQGNLLSTIEEQTGADAHAVQKQIDELSQEGLVVKIDGIGFLPSFPVITQHDAEQHFQVLPEVVRETADRIKFFLPTVKNACSSVKDFSERPFESYSLFVLSNVLLDNFQIRNVEKSVIQSERPSRGGKNYYFSIQEKTTGSEAFGIYGNMYRDFNSRIFGIYGNDRNQSNFLNASIHEIISMFPEFEKKASPKESLIHWLEKYESREQLLEDQQKEWLEKAGLISGGSISVPVFTMQEIQGFQDLAGIFSDPLIGILKDHKPVLHAAYSRSPYARSVTFEEYFIWWYHFYYTAVTDKLVGDGLIHVPTSGNFQYIVIK